ncbi:MAG TPA: DMT family transporter [Ignavibacteriales bacterium]|nr:DMT family transporter [Ignavibacteriales bacterium]
MKDKLSHYWKPLFAVLVWGASFAATKIALAEANPSQIVFTRLILGIIFLAFVVLLKDRNFAVPGRVLKSIVLLALIASFHLWIQVTGLQYTTAANTGWIVGLTPVFMAVTGVIFFHESMTIIRIGGILISLSGLVLLISKGDFTNVGLISNKGDFLVLASSFTWSIYSALNKKISLHFSPILTIFYLFSFMALILSPFTVTPGYFALLTHMSINAWMAIIFLGLFCSGIAYVLWAQSLKEMEATSVGVFLYIEPFVTVFTAWMILQEHITILTILSGLIITLGVFFVNWKPKPFPVKP